jgi:hypothetical protein
MEPKYYTVHLGEWIRIRNSMSRWFHAGKPCLICGTFKRAPVWYSLKTRKVRCLKCFDAEDVDLLEAYFAGAQSSIKGNEHPWSWPT